MKILPWNKIRRFVMLALILVPAVAYATGEDVFLNLNFTRTPLKTVLTEIGRQSSLSVVYYSADVETSRRVSIKAQREKLPVVMSRLLADTKVSYVVQGSYLVLFMNDQKAKDSFQSSAAAESGKRTVSGTVKDESGEPMVGVSVLVAGTTNGTATDIDGNYSVSVTEDRPVLEFSYIGYEKSVMPLGARSVLNVKMKENTTSLKEVVVTAMGIERKAESLTYATQTVGGNELTRAKESNLINSLQGKSAGLVITPNTGGAGGASKILLRGNASILGNNSPLIVVDGIPMYNSVKGQLGLDGGANLIADGSSEGGDALSQLNPDDIASITVLKGANSAALYGSAASNGVLMITTKRGQKGSMRVDVSSSTTFETPLVLPKLQNVYGASILGTKENGFTIGQSSWGGKLSDMTADQLNPEYSKQRLTNNAYNISDYFRTGSNFNNTIALSGGTDKVQAYFSYGNTSSYGIVDKNSFFRHNFATRENFSLFNDRLKINVALNYINQKTNNRVSGGVYSGLSQLYTSARNADLNYYKANYLQQGSWETSPYTILVKQESETMNNLYQQQQITTILEGEQQLWYLDKSPGKNNPWWLINRNPSENSTNHVFGNVALDFSILSELKLQARVKYDYSESNDETRQYATTMRPSDMNERGRLIWQHSYNREFYGDFMFNYAKTFNDFNLNANAGGSMTRSSSNYWKLTPTASSGAPYQEDKSFNQFLLSDIYINGGGSGSDITGGGLQSKNWDCGYFITAQLGYQDKYNLEGSFRDDWYRAFTQFPTMKKHYPYYSVGGNAVLSNIFADKMPSAINELKLRASYSEVGNSIPNSLFLQSATRNPATGAYVMSGQTDFKDPKPETTGSFEVGLDLSAFAHAFNMDITFYNAVMRNQFMSYSGAGGKTVFTNSGKVRNQGVEFTASYNWEINRDFSWKTGVNFSYNTNKILTTAKKQDGTDLLREVDLGNSSGLKIKFLPGGSYGDLYATDYMYDAEGHIRINQTTGKPFIDTSNSTNFLGNMNAKYNLGWSNTFNYKNLNFYFLIDGKIGGKVVSFTEAYLDYYGVSERTAQARQNAEANNIVWTNKKGVTSPGMYMPDGTLTSIQSYYETVGGSTPLGQNYVYNGTNFRMREMSLGYLFKDLFGKTKNLTLSLTARNLFFIYKDAPIDPETSLTTQNALGNVDVFSMPTTRTFGLTLKASF